MEVATNYSKIEKMFHDNGGYITRSDINTANISSWFLYDFVKKNDLVKVAPGYYVDQNYFVDEYYLLQKRYPKYVFSGLSALYLHHLTDKIPQEIDVTSPQGYNPSRNKINGLSIRKISNDRIYRLGIKEVKTSFGNIVHVYDEERTICDMIKYRDKFDSETFIKAIKLYVHKINHQIKLFRYAKILNIEKKVFEILEVIKNDD